MFPIQDYLTCPRDIRAGVLPLVLSVGSLSRRVVEKTPLVLLDEHVLCYREVIQRGLSADVVAICTQEIVSVVIAFVRFYVLSARDYIDQAVANAERIKEIGEIPQAIYDAAQIANLAKRALEANTVLVHALARIAETAAGDINIEQAVDQADASYEAFLSMNSRDLGVFLDRTADWRDGMLVGQLIRSGYRIYSAASFIHNISLKVSSLVRQWEKQALSARVPRSIKSDLGVASPSNRPLS